jgi:hypothetical protein
MSATPGPRRESGISNTIHTMTDSITVAWPVARHGHNLPDDRHVPFRKCVKACPEPARCRAGVDPHRLVWVFPWRYPLPARCGSCVGFHRARLPSPKRLGEDVPSLHGKVH